MNVSSAVKWAVLKSAYLQMGNVWNFSGVLTCVFSSWFVSLHSKAGLTGTLNQYWKSKALVLTVYRSMASAGLCFICTFWFVGWQRDRRAALEAAFCSETQERALRHGWRILKGDRLDIHDLAFVQALRALLFKFLVMPPPSITCT